MYSAEIKRKTVDLENKVLLVDVEYQKDGLRVTSEQFNLAIDTSIDQVKIRIANTIKKLELAETTTTTIAEGAVDLSFVPDTTPTQAEQEKNDWFRDFRRLERLQQLVDLGAFPAALQSDLDALKTKVSTEFKKVYITDL